ncbi:hypothetical protein Y032_0184g1015 [Ancylostoma ceylanicum]|uniref:Uncharacterized protein n=1 Tax=Ancylostoma ceylanicum TaxID=53326 RepID=A0A016SS49_9BILA|nr:hypothetical protein Y032_0184g1015 [Ancylostoma ceylanicum]
MVCGRTSYTTDKFDAFGNLTTPLPQWTLRITRELESSRFWRRRKIRRAPSRSQCAAKLGQIEEPAELSVQSRGLELIL